MKMLKKIYDYFYPEMDLKERIERWCKSLNKDVSYGSRMTHKKLDILSFPRRKFRFW